MTTADKYTIDDVDPILSPGLLFFPEIIRENIDHSIELCGGADRIRPHFKTHKTAEIARMQIDAGIHHHKCATIAEAETLAVAGARDILLAMQMVGPNVRRIRYLSDSFPRTRFVSIVDSPEAVEFLAEAFASSIRPLPLMLDLNSGMNRTGADMSAQSAELYEMIATTEGIEAAGLHWYDGHHHQHERADRQQQVLAGWHQFLEFRDHLSLNGLPVPEIVASGTGSFDILAETGEPNLRVSPGTTTLFDSVSLQNFPELPFRPAALLLTRVTSRPGINLLTLDLGHKSVSADQPLERRFRLLDLPNARIVKQHEEHVVIDNEGGRDVELGEHFLAIPGHVCPTVSLHSQATTIEKGQITGQWQIAARNRMLTI